MARPCRVFAAWAIILSSSFCFTRRTFRVGTSADTSEV